MKKIILILIFLLLPFKILANEIPYKDVALRIYKIPYSKHTFNCFGKSQLYWAFLISKGVNAHIIVGRYKDEQFYRHAWVKFEKDDKWYIVDLTDNPRTWGWEERHYYWLKEEEIYVPR